jgi:hypothetical protein
LLPLLQSMLDVRFPLKCQTLKSKALYFYISKLVFWLVHFEYKFWLVDFEYEYKTCTQNPTNHNRQHWNKYMQFSDWVFWVQVQNMCLIVLCPWGRSYNTFFTIYNYGLHEKLISIIVKGFWVQVLYSYSKSTNQNLYSKWTNQNTETYICSVLIGWFLRMSTKLVLKKFYDWKSWIFHLYSNG